MFKALFLCSGNGGNLKFIQELISRGTIHNLEIVSVICDKECGAFNYAVNQNIDSKIIPYSRNNNEMLLKILNETDFDIIVSNFNKILDVEIVNKFKIINLHYSLLPAYKGMVDMNPVKQAIQDECKFLGTTVHWVNEDVDTGKIISQSIIPVNNENGAIIFNKVFKMGCINLLNAIIIVSDNKVSFSSKLKAINDKLNVTFSPNVEIEIEEEFWRQIQ